MFTGIIRELGTVVSVARKPAAWRLRILAPTTASGLAIGESVAVNGVCLSVVEKKHRGILSFDVIAETRRRTNLGTLTAGMRVNLEPSLRLRDRLNGHFVLGHVDGVGRVLRRERRSGEWSLSIRMDRALRPYLVPKGPITVDGVSLTVGATITPTTFRAFLIPETRQQTTLGVRQAGERVNLEVDYLAKLVAQVARSRYNT